MKKIKTYKLFISENKQSEACDYCDCDSCETCICINCKCPICCENKVKKVK